LLKLSIWRWQCACTGCQEEGHAGMTTIDGFWGITLLVGAGMLLFLGLTFLFITRAGDILSVLVRCPMTGYPTVVQHIADESSFLTDVVSCAAFPRGQPITCDFSCLRGGIQTCVPERCADLVRV
jgi:hypothetical protein